MSPALYNQDEIYIPVFHDLLPRLENQNFWELRLYAEPDLAYKEIDIRLHYNRTQEQIFEYDSTITIRSRFPENYVGCIALVYIQSPQSFSLRFKPVKRWKDKTLFFGADFRSYHSTLPLRYFTQNREDCRCECERCLTGYCEMCCEY